jgi:hypothetical protein
MSMWMRGERERGEARCKFTTGLDTRTKKYCERASGSCINCEELNHYIDGLKDREIADLADELHTPRGLVYCVKVLKSQTQWIECVHAESRCCRMFNGGLVYCSIRLGPPFIAPRQLGAVGAPFGRPLLPSVRGCTGLSGAHRTVNSTRTGRIKESPDWLVKVA